MQIYLTTDISESLLNNSSEIACIIDHKGICYYVNDSVFSILGYTSEEILGTSVFSYVNPEDLAILAERFAARMKDKQKPVFQNYRFFNKNGKTVHLRVIFNRHDGLGDDRYLIHAQDVTSMVETQSALTSTIKELELLDTINKACINNAGLSEIIELVMDSFAQLIPNLGSRFYTLESNELRLVVSESEELARIVQQKTGIQISQIIPVITEGNAFEKAVKNQKIIVESDEAEIEEILKAHSSDPAVMKLAAQIHELIGIKTVALVPFISNGHTFGLATLGFQHHLTSQETAQLERFSRNVTTALGKTISEERIQTERKYVSAIFDNLPIEFALFDQKHRYIYVNANSIRSSDTRNWIIGRTHMEYCQQNKKDLSLALRRDEHFRRAVETRSDVQWLEQHKTSDGAIKHTLRHLYPIFEKDKLVNVLGYGFDVTELVSTKKELQQTSQDSVEYQSMLMGSMMNPHFIFNALNSIQYFILSRETEKAINFVADFSALMRLTLKNSQHLNISLSDEIDYLKSYLTIEQIRLNNKFDFDILIDDIGDESELNIPPMLVQPFVENAIVHGVSGLLTKGHIQISFKNTGRNLITCEISDNGIGRKEAGRRAEESKKTRHKSMAISLTHKRLDLLKQRFGKSFTVEIKDIGEESNSSGTLVILSIPQ